MTQLTRALPALAACFALALATSPASAAKGVKKNGEHLYRGTVQTIHKHQHKKGETLTILTQHHARKKGVQRSSGNRQVPQTFWVDQRTRIVGGKLHQGERVMVAAHGEHADKVTIWHSTRQQHRRRTPTYARRTTHHNAAHHTTTTRPPTTTTPSRSTTPQHASAQQQHATAQHAAHHAQHPPAHHANAPAHPKKR